VSIECTCINVYPDLESPGFQTITERTARKEHVCCECEGDIKPGDKYEEVRGKWDGEIRVFKTCMPCVIMCDDIFCGSRPLGDAHEYIWEAIGVDIITGEVQDDDE